MHAYLAAKGGLARSNSGSLFLLKTETSTLATELDHQQLMVDVSWSKTVLIGTSHQ